MSVLLHPFSVPFRRPAPAGPAPVVCLLSPSRRQCFNGTPCRVPAERKLLAVLYRQFIERERERERERGEGRRGGDGEGREERERERESERERWEEREREREVGERERERRGRGAMVVAVMFSRRWVGLIVLLTIGRLTKKRLLFVTDKLSRLCSCFGV